MSDNDVDMGEMMDVDETAESTRTIVEQGADSKEAQDAAKNKPADVNKTSDGKVGLDLPYRRRDLGGDTQSRHIAPSRSLDVATDAMKSWHRKGPVPWEVVQRVAQGLMQREEWRSAKKVLEISLAGPDDARCMSMYATVLNELDELEDAARLYERLEGMRTHPTSSDEISAISAGGFGRVLMKQGKYDRAVTCFQHALKHFTVTGRRPRSRRTDYLDSAFWRAELARAYMKLKKFDLAHKEQQRVVEDLLAHLLAPERSSVTLTRSLLIAKENLAIIYWHLGEPVKAEKLHVEVLVDILKTSGEGADSWKVMSRMAEELLDSEPDRAVCLLERVVAGQIEALGEDHEDTLSSMGRLADALQRSAEYEKDRQIGEFW